MPSYRLSNRGVEFDHFRVSCKNALTQYKTETELPRSMVAYNFQNISYKKDLFVVNKEKGIRKLYFDPTKRLSLLQES